jgi:hypothetical protein
LAPDTAVVIQVPVFLWMRLVRQLRLRGGGRRESGAFLLGRQRGTIANVTAYVCYDDLDPRAYETGAITFHAEGYAAFWQYCRETKLELLADAHTHPGSHVGQSHTDRRNPMVPVAGHTAMIVPNFGRTPWWSLKGVGVYEYVGNFEWRIHAPSDGARRVVLTWW